jgi:hypothetical protein
MRVRVRVRDVEAGAEVALSLDEVHGDFREQV